MSEEIEGQVTGQGDAVPSGTVGVEPVAVALALHGARQEDASAFLKGQRSLIADQRDMAGAPHG